MRLGRRLIGLNFQISMRLVLHAILHLFQLICFTFLFNLLNKDHFLYIVTLTPIYHMTNFRPLNLKDIYLVEDHKIQKYFLLFKFESKTH